MATAAKTLKKVGASTGTVARKPAAKPAAAPAKTPAKKTVAKTAPTKAAKPAATKTVAKPVTRTAAVKTAAAKPAGAIKISAPLNKTALLAKLVEVSGVEAKQVKQVLIGLDGIVKAALAKKGGAGEITLPGIVKLTAIAVPAKPKRKGINPFTGEEQIFQAKPASVKVKARVLKAVKDAAL